MKLKEGLNQTFHPNGQLAHSQEIKFLSKSEAHRYPNRRLSEGGQDWCRIGISIKYHPNGVVAWSLQYNEFGELVRSGESRRADGTLISEESLKL